MTLSCLKNLSLYGETLVIISACGAMISIELYGDEAAPAKGGIGSWQECQKECRGISACTYFTWHGHTHACFFKRSSTPSRTAWDEIISGPRICTF